MQIRRSVRRGIAVAAAAAGLSALGAGSASAHEPALPDSARAAQCTVEDAGDTVSQPVRDAARSIGTYEERTTEDGAARDAGKAIRHVTQETGQAVSEVPSAAAHQDVGAVSRVPSPAAPSSAPGLPEDLVIEVPEVVPGVPSIGILPLSLPALPVTPGVPSL